MNFKFNQLAWMVVSIAVVLPLHSDVINGLPVDVLARSTVRLPDRVLTLVKIRPPAIPVTTSAPPPTLPPEATEEEKQAALRREAKVEIQLNLETTIYAGAPTITELSWILKDGRRYRVYCPVDFTHLSQITFFETSSYVFDWFPFISEGDPSSLSAGVRDALLANGNGPQYLFEGNEADAAANETTLQAIEYLLAYFELHKVELMSATVTRVATALEQQRQDAAKAAQPKDQTLYFWKNETPVTR